MSDMSDIWARWEKAAGGTWQVNRHDNYGGDINWQIQVGEPGALGFWSCSDLDRPGMKQTAEAIAKAPDDIARLRAEVERLRAEQALDLKDRDHFRAMARRNMDDRDELRAKVARVEALGAAWLERAADAETWDGHCRSDCEEHAAELRAALAGLL